MWLFESKRIQNQRQSVAELTRQVSYEIQEQLNRSLSATYALAAVIRQENGDLINFQQLAREMLQLYPGVSTLMIAPGGVISQAVPLKGNERAIGHNILTDPRRNKEALLALHTRRLTLAGPFLLVQGGEAVVGRLPVYLTDPRGEQVFWGFSIALIRIPVFLKEVGVKRIAGNDCNFEISRLDPDRGHRVAFFTAGAPLSNPINQKIEIPNGEWTLSVEPVGGWYQPRVIAVEVALVLLFSALVALAVHRLAQQPLLMQQMVDERTRELSEANLALKAEVKDRELAQEALVASEHKLRAICAALTDAILIVNAEGRYLEIASTSSGRLYRPASMVGKTVHDIFPREKADFFLSTIGEALGTGRTVSVDYSLVLDGEEVWFAANVSPFAADTVVWAAQDITERKVAEAEQQRLEQQLLHAQKLESLGVLAGGIAHDFNNILMAIIGNADLALMRLGENSPVVKNLQQIEQAAARAADLTRQMLAYSGRGKFVVEAVDLNRLLTEMLHLLEVSISKKARLRLELATNLPPIEVDVTQLHQVVMNLVINASEAIGDQSGEIAVKTGILPAEHPSFKEGWFAENLVPGPYVLLEVSDTGCGMDAETLSRIFDPFFTTKFTGRGLGMAAVLGIVRGHHGAIKVLSEPGQGSVFRVVLPASVKLVSGDGLELGDQAWCGEGRVLLVDDEQTVREVASEMLEELGFCPILATDGREALERFGSEPGLRCVILDLTMPQMSGEECFQELRRLDPAVPVFLSSGYSEQEIAPRFSGCGLAGFIQKPYSLTALREQLKKLG
ncbi:hypothetical protein GMLC_19470 [Geomonas limicola]|uniref:histidine kinase n=2 Tax=Geomonas limicola TaxID=2740186 RepID=A0A6V8N723_9BACT|nr:hypothetical protein GMLC_19470 [Geomonas limicola]